MTSSQMPEPAAQDPTASVTDLVAEVGARLRQRLVRRMESAGVLPGPAWRSAFTEVPRHLFVPVYHRPGQSGASYETLRENDPDLRRRARWLVGVYEDVPLVTHMRNGPVSSSSQPSLMASMLHQLQVRRGTRVLEIGTGTGYNAALLAHRLGDAWVTSVDVDEAIIDAARDHLARAGYRPVVVTRDGALGYPERAPYDRIMATCAVPAIPEEWLRQCAPGALVLAPLASGLVKLRVSAPGQAEGRFLSTPAYFVSLRPGAGADHGDTTGGVTGEERIGRVGETGAQGSASEATSLVQPVRGADEDIPRGTRQPRSATPDRTPDVQQPRERHTGTGVRVLENELFRFALGLIAGELNVTWSVDEELQPQQVMLSAADGSVASIDREGVVLVSGPRDLWALVERAYDMWRLQRHPARERFGVTVDQGRQWIWLDDPMSGLSWPLPRSG